MMMMILMILIILIVVDNDVNDAVVKIRTANLPSLHHVISGNLRFMQVACM